MKKIVIFSHGFGVRKDDRGMLTDIAERLGDEIRPVLFDYNDINRENNTLAVKPLSVQAKIFEHNFEQAKKDYPGLPIVVIGHSQGCVVAAIACPEVEKFIMLAPSPSLDKDRTIKVFSERPGTQINLDSESKLARRDGSTTIVPSEFWKEFQIYNPVDLYNKLSKESELVIVQADNDEVLVGANYENINAKILHIDADHDFTNEARPKLLNLIAKEVL